MTYRLLDCSPGCGVAYAAARTPDVVYVARRSEPADSTAAILEANRALVGDGWRHQTATLATWAAVPVDVVTGSPQATRGNDARGVFLRFALRCDPSIIVMDCDDETGRSRTHVADIVATIGGARVPRLVTLVFYDELALGAARQRRRCAVVASRVEFGVERPPQGLVWPVAPWQRIRRGRGASLTPAVRGFGPDWVWPDAPVLVGMSPWAARWLLEWAVESLSARPGAVRGVRGDDVRVVTVHVLDQRDR